MELVVDDKSTLILQDTLYNSKNPTRRWLHCTRRDWIFSAINHAAVGNGLKALEIGPGSGVYLPLLAQKCETVHAADIAEEFLYRARELSNIYPNISAVRDDITNSNIPDASYDIIVCTEVIEHIPDSQAALRHMRRILRPGGVLILSTPQKFSIMELTCKIAFLPVVIDIVRFIYGEAILETGHINLLTPKMARHQMAEAGFRVKSTFVSGLYIPLIAEFCGKAGLKFEEMLEAFLKKRNMTDLFWTQYYIADNGAS